MRRTVLAFVFVSLPTAALLALGQSGPPQGGGAASASGLDLAAIDRTADACTDFFQYACGGWIAANPMPADRPRWSAFTKLAERNSELLRQVLEQAAARTDRSQQKIGDYYASCMDEATIERLDLAPLEPQLRRIAALRSAADLPELVADLQRGGASVFFGFGSANDAKDASKVIAATGQGGLGLPDRDYYVSDVPRNVELRGAYEQHVARMLGLAGASAGDATGAAAGVMRIETALARGALDRVSRRDPNRTYHPMPPAELQALTPNFNWTRYLRAVNAPALQTINVREPDFARAVNQVLADTPAVDLQAYLRWQLLRATAPLLPKRFVDENFAFYSTTLSGVSQQQPRWRRCVQASDRDLGEALGQAFVEEAFGPQARADTQRMVQDLTQALERDIATLDWMTDETRRRAIEKLHAVASKIGYPDKWRDYSALSIERGDALGNRQRANRFEHGRDMNKIGKPVDKTEWYMTPPTVNAYYNSSENNINFPAGILQPPFYGASRDAAVNYGGAGSVIGHELTHGFDDQGRQFDGAGNLTDWWTAADAKAFDDRAACFVDQYGSYSPVDDAKLNGKLTLGENTADNGGLRIALSAYLASAAARDARELDGFTPEQRVFLGYAQVWCESRRPEYERLLVQTDPHSPGRFRVNGVVSNMPEFQRAFSCKPDAPMVRQTSCRVW